MYNHQILCPRISVWFLRYLLMIFEHSFTVQKQQHKHILPPLLTLHCHYPQPKIFFVKLINLFVELWKSKNKIWRHLILMSSISYNCSFIVASHLVYTLSVQTFSSSKFREVKKSRNSRHKLSRKRPKFAKIAKVSARESFYT